MACLAPLFGRADAVGDDRGGALGRQQIAVRYANPDGVLIVFLHTGDAVLPDIQPQLVLQEVRAIERGLRSVHLKSAR